MDILRNKLFSHFLPPIATADFYTPRERSHQLHNRLREMGCKILGVTISKSVFINQKRAYQVSVSRRCQGDGDECSAYILAVQGGHDIAPCRLCKNKCG